MASDVTEGTRVVFEIARGYWDGWFSPEDLANKVRIPLVEVEVVTRDPNSRNQRRRRARERWDSIRDTTDTRTMRDYNPPGPGTADLSMYSENELEGLVKLGDASEVEIKAAERAGLIEWMIGETEASPPDGWYPKDSEGERVLAALRGLQVTKAATLEFFNEHQHAWPAALDLHWRETHDV